MAWHVIGHVTKRAWRQVCPPGGHPEAHGGTGGGGRRRGAREPVRVAAAGSGAGWGGAGGRGRAGGGCDGAAAAGGGRVRRDGRGVRRMSGVTLVSYRLYHTRTHTHTHTHTHRCAVNEWGNLGIIPALLSAPLSPSVPPPLLSHRIVFILSAISSVSCPLIMSGIACPSAASRHLHHNHLLIIVRFDRFDADPA